MLTADNLQQFTGTSCYYRYMGDFKLTDGVKFMAAEAGAFWLLDIIVSYQCRPVIRKEHFQIWTLAVSPADEATGRRQAVVTMKTDSDKPVMVTQTLKHTDFPLDTIEVWLIDGVLLLPSEY